MRGRKGDEPLELPTYAPGDCKRPTLVDYTAQRPFRTWTVAQMEAVIGSFLCQNPPRLELATLAMHELQHRDPRGSMKAGMAFAHYRLEPILWLPAAHEAVLAAFPSRLIDAQMQAPRGGHVYVMLRGGYSADNGHYGAYVGSTAKSVEKRCIEHRTGKRAARGLPRHGIEPLWSLFSHLNPVPKKKAHREEWETRLHEALAPVVPKVTGDVAF